MSDPKPILEMIPPAGEGCLRFVGDRVRFVLRDKNGATKKGVWRAFLRANLGRSKQLLEELTASDSVVVRGQAWRDLPMQASGQEWWLELPVTETGYFEAKPYCVNGAGRQFWPEGGNAGISVHPNEYRTQNILYCAFVRLFGESRHRQTTGDERIEMLSAELDKRDYAVIPPSGKFRDLTAQIPHIMDRLGCRIVHLLPVNPTPTTFARMGRFGSPYASLNLAAIDPALVVFDRRTTAVDQFAELARAVHARQGRLFLDLAINHTGWGADLHETHPQWYARDPQGNFISPGAWGVVWQDLCELDHRDPALWQYLADVFLIWCRRGVDGFRCDAGYKVPLPAWRYITARVRREFPDTIFLLEGLGGSWSDTERLLTHGGMQWAYSELFQNYSGSQVAAYLDYSLRQSHRLGLWVHYSETHDNDRLAQRGRAWSLLRNQLCALTSVCGSYGFTCGVEWLAKEKIIVHQRSGLSWGNPDHLVDELGRIHRLLSEHPSFFDGAILTRVSHADSPVYGLRRDSSDGLDSVLVLVNTVLDRPESVTLPIDVWRKYGKIDLLGQSPPKAQPGPSGNVLVTLPAAGAYCLAASKLPRGLSGESYRRARAQSTWGLQMISEILSSEDVGPMDWQALARMVEADPGQFLAACSLLEQVTARTDLGQALRDAMRRLKYEPVMRWEQADRRRISLVPEGHWLVVQDPAPFQVILRVPQRNDRLLARSFLCGTTHIAGFSSAQMARLAGGAEASLELEMERYGPGEHEIQATIRLLKGISPETASSAGRDSLLAWRADGSRGWDRKACVLLANGRGGMARLRVDLGSIQSKYDCLLGANLHSAWPVDRHVFVKRARVWVNADGFISPLNHENLISFEPGPPAYWRFAASAGDGRVVEIDFWVDMLDQANTTILRFHRPTTPPRLGRALPAHCTVSLTVRLDIEDRSYHAETQHNGGAGHHFSSHTHLLGDQAGFRFTPAAGRVLRAFATRGLYHHEAEWSHGIPHPVEASRGQAGQGDAYSPGWFEIPLEPGNHSDLVVTAESEDPRSNEVRSFISRRASACRSILDLAPGFDDAFGRQLAIALRAFLVRREQHKTVIAGYPWFLDWGRDSMICARGMLAAGLRDDVIRLLIVFGQQEQSGTLPNCVHGNDTSNRDTSDAPLWYGLVCAEALNAMENPASSYEEARKIQVRPGRSIADVLRSIAVHYIEGTPNGILMDPQSGLVWSPAHFTWMDTQYPMGTPREGYPVEIQALWIRLLQMLADWGMPSGKVSWRELAAQAQESLQSRFWIESDGYLADVLLAGRQQPAALATVDHALRCNALLAASLGVVHTSLGQSHVRASLRHLLVPGAVRSLAPLPAQPPLPVRATDGHLLNDPGFPYWGTYEGDEDTRRKPAYHNGTAWCWFLPILCEALARSWNFHPETVRAAQAYLRSGERLLAEGCLGQLPEIVDGDAPHQQRGCDAQAWSVSEFVRVWRLLKNPPVRAT